MFKKLFFSLCGLVMITAGVYFMTYSNSFSDDKKERVILGRVEYALLENIKFKSRIDTGAGISSLHAKILEIKKPKTDNDVERVVFELIDDNGKSQIFEKKIFDWVNIKSKGSTGYIKRPIIIMKLCLGGKKVTSRVNLADRSDFLYPLLIGRNTLKKGNFLVDAKEKFMKHPHCKR